MNWSLYAYIKVSCEATRPKKVSCEATQLRTEQKLKRITIIRGKYIT